jgi:hypothetical protein
MPSTKTRVIGSGFTTFNYRGQPIAFLDTVSDSGQPLVGKGYEPVTPLGAKHPVEIVTGFVLDVGTLTLQIRELWNAPVWEQLAGFAGVGDDITAIYQRISADPAEVTCQMIVMPPGSKTWRVKTFHNCVVYAIEDGESVSNGALTVPKSLSIAYTHKTSTTIAAGA